MNELNPCPFCGRQPEVLKRPSSMNGFFCAISCFCGELSARAYQFATDKKSIDAAYEKAAKLWNRRAKPENKPLTWIPVNERLPETDTPVLCHCSNNHLQHLYQRVGYWSTDKVWHDSWDGREIPVDYWMPLPNARKPEGSK